MILTFKKKLIVLIEFVHLKLFGHEMSGTMRNFLSHLSWSLMGGIFASAVMMIINILAGRLMGPDEYGKYNLLITLSQLIVIPILFGLDTSSIISISNSKDQKEKKLNITTSLYFVLFTISIAIAVAILTFPYIIKNFPIGETFLAITIIYALITGLKTILESIIRGLQLFKTQFYGKTLEILIICSFFLYLFIYKNNHDFVYYTASLTTGIIFILIYYSNKIVPHISKFNFDILKKQISLGRVLLIGTILGIGFNSIDKIIIAKILNLTELGIYSAYFTVSVNLIAQLTQMFINVFLPVASGINNNAIVKKIDKLYLISFIPILISLFGIIWLAISLFGDKYGINFGYIFSFSILATLQIYLTINSTILTTISKNIFKKFIYLLNLTNLFHLIIYGVLIYFKLISVQLIIILYIINVTILIFIQKKLMVYSYDQGQN